MINQIDFTELREEVLNKWGVDGVKYFYTNEISEGQWEFLLKPEFKAILESPIACIQELGFDTFASYMASKNKEQRV